MAAAAALLPAHAAIVNWGLLGDGFWDVAANWSPGAPGVGDDVIINIPGLRTITFRTGAVTVNSLAVTNNILAVTGGNLTVSGAYTNTGTGRTDISSGALTLNGASTLGALTQSNGSLAGTGTVTVTGAANITFGDHRGTGATILQGTTTISSSGLRLDGGRVLRNEGTVNWTGGQILLNNNVSGASIAGSGTINNVAGSTFTASGNTVGSISVSNFGGADTGADAAFNNAGTFIKSGSTATNLTSIGVAFNNTGTVQVQTGALSLDAGGTHSGSFSGAGTIIFGAGTHTLGATSSITTQDVQFTGSGATTVNGTYNVAGSTGISSGTVTFASGLTSLGSTLALSGGLVNLGSNNATVAQLTQSNGSVSGTGTLTVSTGANITFGDHRGTGTTVLQGTTTVSSSGLRLDGGRLMRNEGTMTWSGGQILFNNNVTGTGIAGSGTLNNAAAATFIVSGDAATSIALSNFGGTDTGADAAINNAGTFRKSGSTATNTTNVDVAFNNTGAVQVQTGVLSFNNGGTHSGSFTGAGTVGFGGGTHVVTAAGSVATQNVNFSGSGTTTISGSYNVAGTTSVSGGTHSIAGALSNLGSALAINGGLLNINASNASVGTLTQSNGSLGGTGVLTVSGNANLTFGDHRGTGTTVLQGATTISSSGFRLDGGRTLRNEGTVTWTGGQILFNNNVTGTGIAGSATLNNAAGATFVVSGDSSATIAVSNFGGTDTGADAAINNAGTFRKSGSTGTHLTTVDVAFNNTGTTDVQTGLLNFTNGGTHSGSFTGAGTLGFGGGSHVVTAAGSVATQNVNFSGAGTTTVNGGYNVAGTTTVNGGTHSIAGALSNLGSALVISNGLLNINASNASVGTLTQSSGSLGGTGVLTISGNANITFGDHRGTGTTVLQGTTTISSSGFRLDGGRTLRNEGTATWNGGQILFNNNVNGTGIAGSGTLINAAGATFIVSGDNSTSVALSNFGGTDTGTDALITNAGTFRKSGSGATNGTNVDVVFNNTGAVQVQSGLLNFSNGGTHTGSFDVAAGTVLGFSGGTHNLNGGGITSPGTVRLSGAVAVNVNTGYAIAGTTDITNGSLNLLGGNASTGLLTQSSGSVSGSSNFTVAGNANITFGDHRGTGTTILQGATTISSSGFRLDGGRVLRNEGALTWSGGQILFNNTVNGASGGAGSGTINNAAGGLFNVFGDGSTSITVSNFGGTDTGADALITNAGTFRKSGSGATNATNVDVAFNNTGAVQVQSGLLNFSNGGTHTGSFDVAAGTVLGFSGGTHNLNGGGITSPGTVRLSSTVAVNVNTGYAIAGTTEITNGSLNLLGGNASTGLLTQSSGSVSGSNNFTVAGNANITFGDHRGTGTTILQGATTLSGSGFRLDGGRTLRNEGALTWNGGQILFNNTFTGAAGGAGSGTINNAAGGLFNIFGDAATSMTASNFGGTDTGTDALMTNAGTLRKSGSGATSTTTVDVAFTNTGTVQAQTGVLSFSQNTTQSGALQIDAGAVLRFANGTQTFNTATTNIAGRLELTNGNIVFNAPHTMTGTGSFNQSSGSISGADLTIASAANITFGDHRGSGSTILQGATSITSSGFRLDGGRVLRNEGTLTWSSGQILFNNTFNGTSGGAGSGTINNAAGGVFNISGDSATSITFSNFGGTDTGADAAINNAGSFVKSGSSATSNTAVDVAFGNTGSVRAQTGLLSFSRGITGTTGTLQIDAGAGVTLSAAGASSTVGTLVNNGGGATSLNLGANTITVFTDYTNAGFGTGNSFNRRANTGITGVGNRIIAGGDANQGITGTGVANGTGATPTLLLGNVHVGTTTYAYSIANTGSSGPALRGAIQTSVNGGSITDARLSGSGVTAGNWGPVATGTALSRDVVLNVAAAGVYAPVSGQSVSIVNNFDNTRSQVLTISSAAGAAAYNLAAAGTLAPNPVVLANQREGGTLSAALTVSNTAPSGSFTEGLNASFGSPSGAVLTNGGSITRLAGGASNGSAMAVSLNTTSAGAKSGTVALNFESDGTGSSGLGTTALASQTLSVSGNVYRLASASSATPSPVNFGNVRIGTSVSQALTVTNTAAGDGFSERLKGSISTVASGITASGSFALLAAQATDNSSLRVGLDTTSAGNKAGNATIAFNSDGTGTSGITPLAALAAQNVAVSGAVYRLANPTLNTPSVTLVARVGDAAPSASVSLTNTSPDIFTERLNASFGATPAGVTGTGSITGLAAGASSNSLGLTLNTTSSRNVTGNATLTLVSSGAGTTGAPDQTLAAQSVLVNARVYTPAVAQLNTPTVDFGIVHIGDAVGARNVSITNAAAIAPANDTLRGSIATSSAGFTATGSLGDLAAQVTDNGSLRVGLVTTAAGVFNSGSATVSVASHNPDLADQALAPVVVNLRGQVNNFAEASLTASGAGALSLSGRTYTLDFGTLLLGTGSATSALSVLNSAIGPADLLSGSFDLTGVGPGFTLSGFGSFADLVAGSSQGGLSVAFLTGATGDFVSSLVLKASGSNASGYIGALADTTLVLRGSVVAVPEPGTWVLMFAGLLVVVATGARQRARA